MAVQLSVTGHCEAIGCAYPSLRLCGGVVVRGGGYYFIRVDEDSERDVDKDERVEVEMEGTSREGTVWARGRSSQCVKELVERGQLDLRVWWCYSRTELPSLACLARSPGQAASGPPPNYSPFHGHTLPVRWCHETSPHRPLQLCTCLSRASKFAAAACWRDITLCGSPSLCPPVMARYSLFRKYMRRPQCLSLSRSPNSTEYSPPGHPGPRGMREELGRPPAQTLPVTPVAVGKGVHVT